MVKKLKAQDFGLPLLNLQRVEELEALGACTQDNCLCNWNLGECLPDIETDESRRVREAYEDPDSPLCGKAPRQRVELLDMTIQVDDERTVTEFRRRADEATGLSGLLVLVPSEYGKRLRAQDYPI